MRRFRALLAVHMVSTLGLALAGPQAPLDPVAVQRLSQDSGGGSHLSVHPATGAARFVRLQPGRLGLDGADEVERAQEFLARYGAVFGIDDPEAELAGPVLRTDRLGHTRLSYAQLYHGLPVFAGLLHAHFDGQGRLVAVNGTFVPGISLDTRPAWKQEQAEAVAVADVRKRLEVASALELQGSKLLVFRSGLVQRVPGRDHLVYEVEVGNGSDVREFVYVDAHDGRVVDRISGVHSALTRQIHEPRFNDVVIWNEGEALPYSSGDPTNDDQVNGLIDISTDAYQFYFNLSEGSYRSWDGQDGTMHSVWKAESISCPNATWNGSTTNYCDGVASDDVAAHEWTHGYTEATHGLIYQWQPGALNEAYSDMFGELIDQLNGAGTDSPDVLRTEGDCSTFGGSLPPNLVFNAPPAIAGPYSVQGANFNPPPPITAAAQVERVDDGDDEDGAASVSDACQPLVGFTPGNIALIDRGSCAYVAKVLHAQNAGALGVIVVNNQDGLPSMGGSDPSISIPSVMLSQNDGAQVKQQLDSGVHATLSLAEATADSIRWLMGEDSFAFGSPIRDMWTPTCKGDPGKVLDDQYWCGSGDNGGVHTNSGIPNHAFALLVDGGTYNGRSIGALGPTKTAQLYWRAMTAYQVPDSDFADHVNALSQSCVDLLGLNLTHLLTGAPSGEVITTEDCTQVAEVMLAVQMAQEPPCSFSPLLDPDTPPLACGSVAFFDDFEQDPAGAWAVGNEGVFAEYVPRDWVWTAELPDGATGSAFFAIDSLEIGNCVEGDDDQSGKMYLDSPPIVLTGDATVAFDHWVSTESGFDGGNLKVSVNDGPFQIVAAEEFIFNPYNDVLITAEANNTNPLAGEPAFTGGDGGTVHGTWGQSQIFLGAHAGAGDTLRIRFEFGVDGCNGLKGWYVDNLLVCSSEVSAGRVPNGGSAPGTPLVVGEASGTEITLDWGASCHIADSDYEIYEGAIGDFDGHSAKFCSTAGATTKSFEPGIGSVYYLVVPRNLDREGSYGMDSDDNERPQGGAACLEQSISASCP